MDRTFDSTTRSQVIRYLCEHGEYARANTIYRIEIAYRRHGETLRAYVSAQWEVAALLRSATRSHTRTAMPGVLDLAFESAIGEWPEFVFVILPAEKAA